MTTFESRNPAHFDQVVTRVPLATATQFAESIGTSASRMSTYVTGKVTPSAAMLMRIEERARRDSNPQQTGCHDIHPVLSQAVFRTGIHEGSGSLNVHWDSGWC